MKIIATKNFKQDFAPNTMALIPIGIVLNLSIGHLVTILKIPIFLDSIGTVLVAALCGPLPGMVTGVLTVFIAGVTVNPVLPWYAGTSIAIGLFSGFWASRGFLKKWWMAAIGGLIMGVIAAVVSAPITAYVFGGFTLSGSSLIVAYLLATGRNILQSVILSGFASDPIDKMITYILVWLLIRQFPKSVLARFSRSDKII